MLFDAVNPGHRTIRVQQSLSPCTPHVIFTTVCLLVFAGLRASDIDILVTNCSIFCPTPSLASMLVNHFKFRSDIQSYHLGGMGCGNGVMAVGLVRDLLQVRGMRV